MTASATAPSGNLVHVLIVSADETLRTSLRERLSRQRWIVREAGSGTDALEKLEHSPANILLVDPLLPDLRIAEFSHLVATRFPEVQQVPLHAHTPGLPTGLPAGLALPDLGDFVLRSTASPRAAPGAPPTTPQSTSPFASQFASQFASSLRNTPSGPGGWQGLVGSSAAMQRVFHAVRIVAPRETSVLITGESGTGKDLVAQAIHTSSPRDRQPFIVINCAAIPDTLIEAELFGYIKGSFTGAVQSSLGRIHAAHGGTLFLDEIGELPFAMQGKLLRFLEQGEVQRIGSSDTLKVDVRVVAATNADLKHLSSQKLFREDLYYRLAVFPIALPPLRDRLEDLDSLVDSFARRFGPGLAVSPAARTRLREHHWPGNVRELRNVIERATLYAQGTGEIRPDDIHF